MNTDKLDKFLENVTKNPSQSLTQKTQKPTQTTAPKPDHKTKKPHKAKKTSSQSSSAAKSPRSSVQAYDPLHGRLTHEKRERLHPVNFLKPKNMGDIRVVPLGGMEQVGLNMMFVEWGNDIVVIDAGLEFPSIAHLGVDVLIPDVSYLKKNKHKIKGLLITHGHLDHIGALPYLMRDLGMPPIYTSRLTKELVLAHSEERFDVKKLKIIEVNPKSKVKLGRFEAEFFHINHSIPEGLGIALNTPYGAIVHSSDFKIDYNPSDDMPADLNQFGRIGARGVALAMVDSTNVEKSGHTLSESVVEKELEKLVERTRGRLIITTFASSIGRIAKLIQAAEANGRTVFISGRSMERNIAIARKLNYLKCKDKTLQRMSKKANSMDPSKVMILSTGSQGEELAALTRMAAGIHKDIKLTDQDNIVFSSSPIPGNELAIVSVLNNLAEIGCRIVDKKELDIYVSGHGHREELKLFSSLMNPKYSAPIHGELYMRHEHKKMLVKELGHNPNNVFIMKNGQGVVLTHKGARLMTEKERLVTKPVMIELSEPVGEHVLADRTQMADDGALFIHIDHHHGTVKRVDIRARGFVYMGMQHEIFKLLENEMKKSFHQYFDAGKKLKNLEDTLQKIAEKLIVQKFKKEPLVEVIL
jgi:ribonuclease J